jgi:hypothetical protein
MSQRISGALSLEFEGQAAAEVGAGLAVTVMLAHDAVAKAKMEIGFLGACC